MPNLLERVLGVLLTLLGSASPDQIDGAIQGSREIITALSELTPEEARNRLSEMEVDLEAIASNPDLLRLRPWVGTADQAAFVLQALRQIA